MGKKYKVKNRRKDDCDPLKCGMQTKLEQALDKFTHIAEGLAENHTALRLNVVTLTENMKGLEEVKLDMKEMQKEIRKNSALVYKIVGGGMALAALIPHLLKYVHFSVG